AQRFVRAQQFGIDLVQSLGAVLLGLGRRVIADVLEIGIRIVDLGPPGQGHLEPFAVGLQAPLEHELGFALDGGQAANHILVEPLGEGLGFDLRDEAGLVVAVEKGIELVVDSTHLDRLQFVMFGTVRRVPGSGAGTKTADVGAAGAPGPSPSSMSATVTDSSVRRTIRLMRCQCERIWQAPSTLQAPGSAVHSVRPKGCSSRASMIWATLIRVASRPRR